MPVCAGTTVGLSCCCPPAGFIGSDARRFSFPLEWRLRAREVSRGWRSLHALHIATHYFPGTMAIAQQSSLHTCKAGKYGYLVSSSIRRPSWSVCRPWAIIDVFRYMMGHPASRAPPPPPRRGGVSRAGCWPRRANCLVFLRNSKENRH